MLDYRPENSALARLGDACWFRVINPVLLVLMGRDVITAMVRLRLSIQIILVVAVALTPFAFWLHSGPALNAAGLLFDIAGVVRLFMLEQIREAVASYADVYKDRLPSVATREFISPEIPSHGHQIDEKTMDHFYYEKRGVLFLFIGFALQMMSDII